MSQNLAILLFMKIDCWEASLWGWLETIKVNDNTINFQTSELPTRNLSRHLCAPWGGFLKIIPIGIPAYTGMKTSF